MVCVAAVTAVLGIAGIKMNLERRSLIDNIKEQILALENSLSAAGYDVAYDHLSFSYFSPWQIMRIKNLKLYSLDSSNYHEWQCDEFSLSSPAFSGDKLRFHFSSRQSFQAGNKSWDMNLPKISAELNVNHDGQFQDFRIEAENINIQKLLTLDKFKFAVRQTTTKPITADGASMEILFDAKNIRIADYTGWPLNKEIDHIYANASIIGSAESHPILGESLYTWIENDGHIELTRLIINWKPLVLVAKGELYFDEHLSLDLSLNTSSLALTETLDRLNQQGWLEDKGVFVAKILLNNKSFKKNQTDAYYTVTTPVKINNKQILIENIPVKKF